MEVQLVIGEDITIHDVYSALISTPASSALLSPSLLEVGYSLGASSQSAKRLSNRVTWDQLTWKGALFEVLEDWVARSSDGATLEKLVEALELNDLRESAKTLKKKFAKQSDGYLIADISGCKPNESLLKETLPSKLPYYINRMIKSRNVLSKRILKQPTSTDTFVFSGVTLSQLSAFLHNVSATNSAEQLMQKKISGKFIVLNHPSHFEKICKKVSGTVHWLSMEEDRKLRWMKSERCDMSILRLFVEEEFQQDLLKEDEFCQKLNHNNNDAVCIVDTPGMGKSVLLAEMGRRLKKIFPDREIVFLSMSEFINEMCKICKEVKLDFMAAIQLALENLLCKDEDSKKYFRNKIHNSEKIVNFELLLDGLDEVHSTQESVAYETLELISSCFKAIRIWVTSRPHLLQQLEKRLKVLGHQICPFTLDDQLSFITSYWAQDEISNTSRLREFAERFLQETNFQIGSREADIAGIPLQCKMIAEVSMESAQIYAESTGTFGLPVEYQLDTIGDLYKLLFEKKIEKYSKVSGEVGETEMLMAHYRLAFDLLFPEFNPISTANVRMEEVLKFGLMHASDRMSSPTFIHRTIPEYLVAKYVTDKLNKKHEWTLDLNKFLVEKLLDYSAGSYKFTSVFPTFLNCMIDDRTIHRGKFPYDCHHSILPILKELLFACAHADCLNLCKLIVVLATPPGQERVNEFHNIAFEWLLVFTCAEVASLPFFKYVLSFSEFVFSANSTFQWKTLELAVKRGRLSIVQFLLNERGLRNMLANFPTEIKGLLHDCVKKSQYGSEELIKRRIEIARLLVRANIAFLEHTDDNFRTPLQINHSDLRLRIALIELGANCLVRDEWNNTVLHVGSYFLKRSPSRAFEYHRLITTIPVEIVRELVLVESTEENADIPQGRTPLQSVLELFDPIPETLDIFKATGADFNHRNGSSHSILTTAVMRRREVATVLKLIECGANIKLEKSLTGKNLLHFAAEFGNWNAVEFLVKEHNFDVNSIEHGSLEGTPLQYAINSGCSNDETKNMLIALGAK